MSLHDVATRLLNGMARSDVATVHGLCHEDVVVYGTDEGERWAGRRPLLDALQEMRPLGLAADWSAPPTCGSGWVAGVARYTGSSMEPTLVRVTMAFEGGRLAHAHFSIEAAPA